VTGKQIGNAADMQPTAPKRIPSDDAAIEIWLARLDLDTDQIRQCEMHLSQDELRRANRFHFERDRRRFIAARATLRILLGGCLAVRPDAIALGYTGNGKPFVADPAANVHFNVSHAHERALYAISKSRALGVDIEYLNRDIDYSGLAERFFTNSEYASLQRIPESGRKRAFLACWTRKEAVIKATGEGLSLPLDQFEVTVEPDAEPRILFFAAATQQISDWTLCAADVGSDYIATVAAYRGK
jgi:4'-phosphopantetheinyl transferase